MSAYMPPLCRSVLLAPLLVLAFVGCQQSDSSDTEDSTLLPNSGKDDGLMTVFNLTDSADTLSLAIQCDGSTRCNGDLYIEMRAPDVCALIDDPQCGAGQIAAQSIALARAIVTSDAEGVRELSLRLETRDGLDFSSSLSAAFTVDANTRVDFIIEKIPEIESLTLAVTARWEHVAEDFAPPSRLESYLDGVDGLSYTEIGSFISGYRSYALSVEQPLDHDEPDGPSFIQNAVLHHRDVAAPMVLYTSGYSLFSTTNLSEVTQLLAANQLSTEQRFFSRSRPDNLQPADWEKLTIEQAAADHHRIVSILKPFYDQKWLSTGHSKGGMTSVFHKRFYPDDVDATLAYVAPISFEVGDPRYSKFLDTIGTEDCRNSYQGLQTLALTNADTLQPQALTSLLGETFERFEGGHAAAWEYSVTVMDWGFWQSSGPLACQILDTEGIDEETLANLVTSYAGWGATDSDWARDVEFAPYYYQAMNQLGIQRLGAARLDPFRKFDKLTINRGPEGVPVPEFDSSSMRDIQDWVKTEADDIVFIYGEFDPWSGGAYDIGDNANLIKVVAPGANHSALLSDLSEADRNAVADRVEELLGVPLHLNMPLIAPRPPRPPTPALP